MYAIRSYYEFDAVGKTERQSAHTHRQLGRQQLAVDRVPPFAVKRFSGNEFPFRGRDDIAAPGDSSTSGFVTQADRGDADAEFEADRMVGFVQGRVAARWVGVV